ncbi:MAG: gamma carbonic anhydrase family protein [Spirochaetia bacterium]|jgi:carbonic anhydrase/acetyltransferase-like protein (isoleucine patch superfamily)|nr:gamma carbonic anhydrase family protein [Spirochaetia bacterium]
MIHAIGKLEPTIAPSAFIAWNAEVAGEAFLGENSSIWFGTIVRADISYIRIGSGSNLQDGVVAHVNTDMPCIIGQDVTVGHMALLHACIVGDACLIGMGSILLNEAEVGEGSIVAAGSLVTPGKRFPPRSFLMGSPARLIRQVSDEEYQRTLRNSAEYVRLSREAKEYRRLD